MITSVYKAIRRHLRNVEYHEITSSYVAGENVETSTTGSISAAILPMSPREARYFPDAMYDVQDKVMYEIGSATLSLKSKVVHDSKTYYIHQKNDRNFEGGFVKYHLKEDNQ